ncbi:YqaJ viral recombinase family protein [Rhodoplanes elegans]|uniref:YqaJ viral recombinase family protein n=1 Tax=Rhodoplanes elegans TaxID=29408 RepID=UPI001FD2868E|nr:YqaJ viral recombinase family protein [Rhodoplanes elegans]
MKFSFAKQELCRRTFLGGSDARIVMGRDERALTRLWREKRGEVAPRDLSNELVVQLGHATEPLNRRWYEKRTGYRVGHVQRRVAHVALPWMAATLDGLVEETGAVFEAKFMLPWSFSESAAVRKHMAQLQHNMLVVQARSAVLSIITGGGKWVLVEVQADPLYQTILRAVEKAFWRAVQTGEAPRLWDDELPEPRLQAMRVVDMATSNAWAEYATLLRGTHPTSLAHQRAQAELRALLPWNASEASGHGVRVVRTEAGRVTINLTDHGRARPQDVLRGGAVGSGAPVEEAAPRFGARRAPAFRVVDRFRDEPGRAVDGWVDFPASSDAPEPDEEAPAGKPGPDGVEEEGGPVPTGTIDKSVLSIATPKRRRDKAHLGFVARRPCLVCGRRPSDPHHLRFAQPRALGRKVSDEYTVPLCRTHHRALHRSGDERRWWSAVAIEPIAVAQSLWSTSRRSEPRRRQLSSKTGPDPASAA